MKVLSNLDLVSNQIQNALAHPLGAAPASPVEGQFYYNSTSKTFQFYSGSAWVILGRLDQISAPTAAVPHNGQRITGLGDPTAAQDAATKAYVDALSQGINWKAAVRAASTANVAVATGLVNGAVIDGVTLATGDRVLLKNQTVPAENGIYVVVPSGAASRATDADTAAEVLQAAVFVQEGSTLADTLWVGTANAPLTLGTTALPFAQMGAGTLPTAGAGLTLTGNTLDVGAGIGITVGADTVGLTVPVSVANGGTNATTAAAARTSLGAVGKFAASIGDGAATSYVVTHNLGTTDVQAFVFRVAAPNDQVFPDVQITSTNTVTILFATAPAASAYRVVVVG